MAPRENLKHIKVDGFASAEKYKPIGTGIGGPKLFKRDRKVHGERLLAQIQQIQQDYNDIKLEGVEQGIVNDEVIYVDFYSAINYEILFDRLNSTADKLKFKLLNITKEKSGDEEYRYKVTVVLAKGGITEFTKKIQAFLTEDTKEKLDKDGNVKKPKRPLNEDLLSNIEEIKKASVKSFWSEATGVKFPEDNEVVWWEVWFRRSKGNEGAQINRIEDQIKSIGAEMNQYQLLFPEHIIRLVKASPLQLSKSLMLLDSLAELRKPQETADFFTKLSIKEKDDWTKELQKRIKKEVNENSVAVCILDTGVNHQHPLLIDYLPEANLHSWNSAWGKHDSHSSLGGHGTGMASLCLYGDLTAAFASSSNIRILHQLESVKILHEKDPNDPKLYGTITLEACSTPVIDFPNRLRVYCMAITAPPIINGNEYWGRPSSWSSAVDNICFGDENSKNLLFISGGNVEPQNRSDYQTLNETSSIHDPGQAFNAVTVGGFTELDVIDLVKYPNHELIAPKGDLAPTSSTSLFWLNKWPIKPDIVMEAGNYAHANGEAKILDSLQLLATHKDFRNTQFQTFGDTSGAVALASKMAAELRAEYPTLWPETIRALMVHSAEWTSMMRGGKTLQDMNAAEKRNILRKFGYGVPNGAKAKYSATNSLTLIAENKILPFELQKGNVKYKEFHLYELPWPSDVLQNEVFDKDCIITTTLSYFIEPNPGNRLYSNSFSYQSHGLAFRVIGKDERKDVFLKRISAETREKDEEGKVEKGFAGEPWIMGSQTRERGSIQKDFLSMTGAEMALRNTIAVFPKGGWYKARPKEQRYNLPVRYSLIISIETPTVDVDLYNPVFNLIPNPIII